MYNGVLEVIEDPETYTWKEVFPIMPRILCITDKRINTEHKTLNIRTCKWDLSDLKI